MEDVYRSMDDLNLIQPNWHFYGGTTDRFSIPRFDEEFLVVFC